MNRIEPILPDTDIAVLGMLKEKPSYGYEIEQRVESRGMRNWTAIEQSSIYNSLHRLKRNGLLQDAKEEVDGRLRKVYRLTKKGISTLKAEVFRLLSEPPHPISSFDLGIGNIYALPRERAIEALVKYRASQEQGIAFLAEHAKRMRKFGVIIAAWLFERPMQELKTRIVWLDKTIEELKTLPFPQESGESSKEEKHGKKTTA
ncbi:PadR family transcriptional regulator [candidate division WOR-3 bacterium]|nr:PadR family transcriptional regulator [candidate division WOR-3 bacterium]